MHFLLSLLYVTQFYITWQHRTVTKYCVKLKTVVSFPITRLQVEQEALFCFVLSLGIVMIIVRVYTNSMPCFCTQNTTNLMLLTHFTRLMSIVMFLSCR